MSALYKQNHKFQNSTITIALDWVYKFLKEYAAESSVKEFLKKTPSNYSGIPVETPYKEGWAKQYNSALAKVTNDEDRRMFSYLCRVFVYHYSLHKGYVKNDSFDLAAYITNSSHQLYELGVLKLGREEMPVGKSQVVQEAADKLDLQTTDIVLADMLELETKVTAFSFEINNHRVKQWEEPNMNQITSLANVAKSEATLIHGRLLSELSESDLIQMIRKARKSQEDIKDLVDTSTRMKARYQQLEADIKVYAEALDSLPNGDQPF